VPHLIIILDAKLDCVAKEFPNLTNEVESLRVLCHAAEAIVVADLVQNPPSPLHEQLHAAQLMAESLCGSSTFTEGEVCGQLAEMTQAIEKLL
jgi:hypothetical protein